MSVIPDRETAWTHGHRDGLNDRGYWVNNYAHKSTYHAGYSAGVKKRKQNQS